jgi:alkylhydroperoxidase family enzyme
MQTIPMPSDDVIKDVLDRLPAELRQRVAGGPPMLNVFRQMMHSPAMAMEVFRLGTAMYCDSALSPTDRELVILACGKCYGAPYETAQHQPIAAAVGVGAAQRTAIDDGDWTADCFTPGQRTLLTFVAALAAHPQVPEVLLSDMKRLHGDRQTVETVMIAGLYFLIARVTTIFDVPLDPPVDDRMMKAAVAMRDAMPTG